MNETKSHQAEAENPIDPVFGNPAYKYATKNGVRYFIEKNTDTIFQEELPSVENMEDYLDEQYTSGVYKAYNKAREFKIKTGLIRLEKIISFGVTGKKCADIGCSTGAFIEAADQFGFETEGFELSTEAIELAPERIRKKIIRADVNQHLESTSQRYNLITAYDILEHMQDPRAFLVSLKKSLEPSGVLAIATPDTSHFLRRIMGVAWPMLQPMQHTVLFSRKGLKKLLEELGFIDVKIFRGQKVLTLRYLFDQVKEPSPSLGKFLSFVAKFLPRVILDYKISLNISEMFVVCRLK